MVTMLQNFLNSSIHDAVGGFRGGKRDGDLFGVEVELEGMNVDKPIKALGGWGPHNDGSLRPYKGYNPCEWVFNGPANYKTSLARIDKLFEAFDSPKHKIVCSNRTSVHVHFNMGDKNVYQLVNMFILFTILDGILDSYCGEDRKGNLFCLSTRHAQHQLAVVNDMCFSQYAIIIPDDMRYCSFNMASIRKFGTVEFRGMRGLDNSKDLRDWLEILNEFTKYACYNMKNPISVIEEISMKGPVGFLSSIFSPPVLKRLTENLEEPYIYDSIYEGLRLVQMLCYKIGTEFDKVKIKGKDFWATLSDEKEVVIDEEIRPFDDFDIRPHDIPIPAEPPRPLFANAILNQVRMQQVRPRPMPADPIQLAGDWAEVEARVMAAHNERAAERGAIGRADEV